MNQSYNYLVAEDESLIRRNLIKKIASLDLPLHLAGEASNGMDAILLADKFCPELVITDIRMPQCDGLEVAAYLQRNHPDVKIIIISGFDDFSYAQSAIRYGVKDYLLKPIKLETLSESLHKLLITVQKESEDLEAYSTDSSSLDQESICKLMEKYLQENYCNDISFQVLSDRFGFTPEYLTKNFKKYTGETPSKYLTRLRMNEAKHLLLGNPELEIQKIGELVGYQDAFYFSRAFKSYTGMRPSEFRSNFKVKGNPTSIDI